MKNIGLILVLLFTYAFSKAQNAFKVDYEMKVNVDKIMGMENMDPVLKAKIIESKKNEKPQKQTLYYYKGDSFYTNEASNFGEKEISNTESKEENKTTNTVLKSVFTPLNYYHLKNDDKIYKYNRFENDEFYGYEKPNWKAINYKDDVQKIDDFNCKLVEITLNNGAIVKVWYTEQIPINAGPLMYYDFPGLVLKVETPTTIIYATKVSNDAKDTDVKKPNPNLKVYTGVDLEKKQAEIKEKRSQPTVERKKLEL